LDLQLCEYSAESSLQNGSTAGRCACDEQQVGTCQREENHARVWRGYEADAQELKESPRESGDVMRESGLFSAAQRDAPAAVVKHHRSRRSLDGEDAVVERVLDRDHGASPKPARSREKSPSEQKIRTQNQRGADVSSFSHSATQWKQLTVR
jgi:hypothetical protein